MGKNLKRIILLAVAVGLAASYGFYYQSKQVNKSEAVKKIEENTFRIIMYAEDANYFTNYERNKMYEYMMKTGNNIKIEQVQAESRQEYQKKLNEELYKKDGPALIYFGPNSLFQEYIDNGVALQIENKLEHYKELYPRLQNGYFVPVNLRLTPLVINRKAIEGLGHTITDETEGISLEEFVQLRAKWLKMDFREINRVRFYERLDDTFYKNHLIDYAHKKVNLTNDAFVNDLIDIHKEMFSDQFIQPADYTLESYKDLINNWNSADMQSSMEKLYDRENFDLRSLNDEYGFNLLNLKKNYFTRNYDEVYILNPIFKEEALSAFGYIVNQNGKNVDYALDFLDQLIDANNQMAFYSKAEQSGTAPSNAKTIDMALKNPEKMGKTDFELHKMKLAHQLLCGETELEPSTYTSIIYYQARAMINEKAVEIVFRENNLEPEYIKRELMYLENKLNIMINE